MNNSNTVMSETTSAFGPRAEPRYVTVHEPNYGRGGSSLTISRDQAMPTESTGRVMDQPTKVFVPPAPIYGNRVFLLLQLWEGKITRVNDEDFAAILTDKTNTVNPEEEVVIDRQEVPDDDQRLLRPGAIFYWSIGYENEPGRPRRRVSQIRLRRLPGWTRRELDEARKKADQLADLFL